MQNYVDVLRGLDVHRYPYVGVAWIWINSLPEGTEVAMSPENIRAIFNRTALHKYLDLPPLDVSDRTARVRLLHLKFGATLRCL